MRGSKNRQCFERRFEGSKPLDAPSDSHLEEDDKGAVDGANDEDVPLEISCI